MGRQVFPMARENKKKTVLQSLRELRGNARVAVFHEPFWSIPYGFYSFYLSLYMKSQGVTDVQIGFLISLNFIVGTIMALFAGVMVDKIGRRRTTILFGLISWPGSALLNFFAHSFWMFALAQIVCAFSKISDIGWQLILIEDADDEQRLTSFNMFGIIDILAGFFTPIAGIIVGNLELVKAERGFLLFGAICMFVMIIHRHFKFHETDMGRLAVERSRTVSYWGTLKNSLTQMKTVVTSHNHKLSCVLVIIVLFSAYQPIGAYSSLYFAPYLTDVVGLDAAMISVLGTVFTDCGSWYSNCLHASPDVSPRWQHRLDGGIGSAVFGGIRPVPPLFGCLDGRSLPREGTIWHIRPEKRADLSGFGTGGKPFRIFVPAKPQKHLFGVFDPAGSLYPVYLPLFSAKTAGGAAGFIR